MNYRYKKKLARLKTDTKKKLMHTQVMVKTILPRSYSETGVEFIKPT